MRSDSIRTNVADIPGYPTRKLLLGFPRTRTNAAMFSAVGPLRGLAPKKELCQRAAQAVGLHSVLLLELSKGVSKALLLGFAMRSREAYGQLAWVSVVGLAAVWYSLILVSTDDDVRGSIEFSKP